MEIRRSFKLKEHSEENVYSVPDIFDESADDDEVLLNFFRKIDTNGDGMISKEEIEWALVKFKNRSNAVQGLEILMNKLSKFPCESECSLNLKGFGEMVREIPRIHGQRIQWARSLHLDSVLARHLKVGSLFDELSGIMDMTETEVKIALEMFSKDVYVIIQKELTKLRNLGTEPEQAMSAISKFSGGFTGKFGDTQMFQGGLESEIGSPDAMILKGILRENTLIDQSCREKYRPSNYGIVTSDLVEYARVFGNPDEYGHSSNGKLDQREKIDGIPNFLLEVARGLHEGVRGPSEAELKDLKLEFQRLTRVHSMVRKMSRSAKFPGEIGDVLYTVKCEVHSDCIDGQRSSAAFRKAQSIAAAINNTQAIYLDLGALSNEAFAVTVCSRKPLAVDALLAKLERELGESVSAGATQNLIYARYGSDVALDTHIRRLEVSELRQRAGLSAAAADECAETILAEFRATTDEWRARGGMRVQGRVTRTLRELMAKKEVRAAGLRVEEAIQAYQYTGPSFQVRRRLTPTLTAPRADRTPSGSLAPASPLPGGPPLGQGPLCLSASARHAAGRRDPDSRAAPEREG